jgi:glycosyltransferase involved in cell wall biosynthesis
MAMTASGGRGALPRIAVLLSTYNGEAFLAAQLDSLLAQRGVAVEVFARDDGSGDGTVAILARYGRHWPGLAATAGGGNIGAAASFLTLLAEAPEGFDYYAFSDQDDVWAPDKLARAVETLEAMGPGGPRLYCSRVTCVDERLRPLGEAGLSDDTCFERQLFDCTGYGNTMVMDAAARALIASRLPADGAVMHDWWCGLVLSALGRFVHDPWSGVLYRQHGRNIFGANPRRGAEILGHLRDLLRNRRRFYPIHAQAAALARLHGDRLSAAQLRRVEGLVNSRRSLPGRLAYAALGPVSHFRLVGAIAARGLIALGWY